MAKKLRNTKRRGGKSAKKIRKSNRKSRKTVKRQIKLHKMEVPHESIGPMNTSNSNELVVGKIYANWCGHCQNLEPTWKTMKSNLTADLGDSVHFYEIEQTNEQPEVDMVNQKYLQHSNQKLALQRGYPTIFRIKGGNLSYYGGNHELNDMSQWVKQ